MVWSAINGVGLALVIPCIQSLIADYNPPERRGSAFGTLFFISSMGELPRAIQPRCMPYPAPPAHTKVHPSISNPDRQVPTGMRWRP